MKLKFYMYILDNINFVDFEISHLTIAHEILVGLKAGKRRLSHHPPVKGISSRNFNL